MLIKNIWFLLRLTTNITTFLFIVHLYSRFFIIIFIISLFIYGGFLFYYLKTDNLLVLMNGRRRLLSPREAILFQGIGMLIIISGLDSSLYEFIAMFSGQVSAQSIILVVLNILIERRDFVRAQENYSNMYNSDDIFVPSYSPISKPYKLLIFTSEILIVISIGIFISIK